MKRSATAGAFAALPGFAPFSRVLGANDDVRVAVVGFRSKGAQHIGILTELPGVRITALCDADKDVLSKGIQQFKEKNESVNGYLDVREVLDDKNVDAILTATPNHWHSLLTVWACQAGKDVYVEKPISHNIWEGRKAVEAARKHKRIVQAGTQSRSDEGLAQVFDYIRQGNLGAIKLARGFCYKRRESIGKVAGPQPIPQAVDFDLWTGPAELAPLRRTRLHYDWHWFWPTGNGDLGNQGIHQVDICRWAIGQDKLAPRVMSIGGRFGYSDDGHTANTQIVWLGYEPVPIIFEVRGLPRRKDASGMDNFKGVRIGVVIECEGGYFAGSTGGGWVYDNDGKKIQQFVGLGAKDHQANFIKAVRSRKVSDLNADIEEGHISSALCHQANISHRLGRQSDVETIQEKIKSDSNCTEAFRRFQDHLFENWVDLKETPATLGPSLAFDPVKERFIVAHDYDPGFWANKLVKGSYREPFVIPEKV